MKWLLLIAIVLHICIIPTWAKDIDVSFCPSAAYDRATWQSGILNQPLGPQTKSWVGLNFSAQVKYTRWRLQPTVEIGYRKEKFDYATWQAPIQKSEPIVWRFLGGVSYDLGKGFTTYLLAGASLFNYNGSLIEAHPYIYHGVNVAIHDTIFTAKIGGYWLYDTGFFGLKIGPEASVEIFGKRPGFSRCRENPMSQFVPSAGIRIQW